MILSMKSSYQGGGSVAPLIKARSDPTNLPIQTIIDIDDPSKFHQQTTLFQTRSSPRELDT